MDGPEVTTRSNCRGRSIAFGKNELHGTRLIEFHSSSEMKQSLGSLPGECALKALRRGIRFQFEKCTHSRLIQLAVFDANVKKKNIAKFSSFDFFSLPPRPRRDSVRYNCLNPLYARREFCNKFSTEFYSREGNIPRCFLLSLRFIYIYIFNCIPKTTKRKKKKTFFPCIISTESVLQYPT